MRIITRMCQDGMTLPAPDRREFGTFSTRPLPFALSSINHARQPDVVARIDEVAKDADGVYWGRGETASTAEGTKAATLIREDMVTTVSVDAGAFEMVEKFVDPDNGESIVIDDAESWEAIDEWLNAHPDSVYVVAFPTYEIGELSLTTISGWPEARIWDADAPDAPAWPEGDLQASAAAPRVREFDPAWFEQQDYAAPTPLTIDRDGRVTGHVCLWDTCHRGFAELGKCITPPREASLADFHGGVTPLTDGSMLRTGLLTFSDLHTATGQLTREEIMRAVEDTGTQLGPVRAYKDQFGIQVAGGLHDDVTPTEAGRAMAGTPSGDWRGEALYGIHVVNCGAFPVLDGDLTPDDEYRLVLASALPPALQASACGCGGTGPASCSCAEAGAVAASRVIGARVRAADMRAARGGLSSITVEAEPTMGARVAEAIERANQMRAH